MSNDQKIIQNFRQSNKFEVDIIKNNDSNIIDQIYIMPMIKIDEEKKTLASDCLYNMILNVQGLLNQNEHEVLLAILTPGLSDLYFRTYPDLAVSLIETFDNDTKVSSPVLNEAFNNSKDPSTKLNIILTTQVYEIIDDAKTKNFTQINTENKDFINLIMELLCELPDSYIDSAFSYVIDITDSKKINKKKKPK